MEIKTISREEFLRQVGVGAAFLLIASCAGSCVKTSNSSSSSSSVDMIINVSSGPLSQNGGSLIQSGVIIARTNSGTFIAVAATCTHQGGTLGYQANTNEFVCPVHGAIFNASGSVVQGPANTALQKYNTSLSGTSLRVYS